MNDIPIDQNAKIGQVHLKVSDINKSLEFYKSFLGFKIVEQTDHSVFLSCDGGTTNIDTLSNGFFFDEGEGRLNLGSTGTACTAPDGKVTVSSEQLRVQVDFSGNQELLESGLGADTHTESGAIVYGGSGGGCTFQFKVTTIQHSPYDSGFFDIDTTTGGTFTGTYYVGSTVFASSYGSFGTTSADVDATINSVSITGV